MMKLSLALHEPGPQATLDAILRADTAGVSTVWLTSGGGDQLTLFAAAVRHTERVKLGTAILPVYPRHPAVVIEQALILEALAPGRLRLGLGPSHAPMVEERLGLRYAAPLGHTREFLAVLRQAFTEGKVDFEGRFYRVKIPSVTATRTPLYISALQSNSFELAGEISDGAQSWVCPARYLGEVAVPALAAGASRAGRPTPPLIGHVFLAVGMPLAEARSQARERLALYPRLTNYRKMLDAAGIETGGEPTDAFLDSVLIAGSESECVSQLEAFSQEAGADELICSHLSGSSLDAALKLVGAHPG